MKLLTYPWQASTLEFCRFYLFSFSRVANESTVLLASGDLEDGDFPREKNIQRQEMKITSESNVR